MFPYACDAPLYYLPIASGALIALNIAAFLAAVTGNLNLQDGWLLEYGTGLHPLQWVLSVFMHRDFGPIIGNMFFLWTFGLITEGKLGWWRFLLCFLAIGVGQAAIEQAIMANYQGEVTESMGGASAAIFGIVAMGCLWAPVNELSVLCILGFRPFTFEMAVGLFGALYAGIDVLTSLLFSGGAGSSLLHIMGGLIGAAIGVVLLKSGVVDCEDWDLFSVLSGSYGSDAKKKRDAEAAAPDRVAARQSEQALEARRRFEAYLEIDQPEQSLAVRRRMADLHQTLEVDRKQLMRLIAGLHRHKRWAESAPVMAELIERFPEGSSTVRLKLAQICLLELAKPGRALELLAGLDGAALSELEEHLRRKIVSVANKRIAEGDVELDDGEW